MIPSLEALDVVFDELVEKGDFVGHPFRGNQWVDASGVSQGGAGSTPDQDKRAYELRQQGKSWDDIAKELGYANGGSVRRLAMRHEARLKDGEKDLKIVPPVTPDVPKPPVEDTSGKISSLADPTSVRAARKLFGQMFPDGVVDRMTALYQTKVKGGKLSPEETKFLEDFERAGELLAKAIEAETLRAISGESSEQAILRRDALKAITVVADRLANDHDRLGLKARNAASLRLFGLTEGRWGTLMKMDEKSLIGLLTLVEKEFARSGSDSTTQAHEYTLLTGDVNTEIDYEDQESGYQEVRSGFLQALSSSTNTLNNFEIRSSKRGTERTDRALRKIQEAQQDDSKTIFDDSNRSLLLQADTLRVAREANEIVSRLMNQIDRGETTLEKVQKLSFDQIVKQADRQWQKYSQKFEDKANLFRENKLLGEVQPLGENDQPSGPVKRGDPAYGILGVQARTTLVVNLVREAFQDEDVQKSLRFQAENVLKEPLSVPSVLINDSKQSSTVPKGGNIHQVRAPVAAIKSTHQESLRTEDDIRVQSTVKILESMGVKFSKPSDIPIKIEQAGNRSYRRGTPVASPAVLKDYTEAISDTLKFIPKGLADGSGSESIVGRFSGGGKLEVIALAGSGVRRAHAQNLGSGKVLVTNPRPKRNKEGNILEGDRSVFLHEIGHGIEYANPWVRYVEHLTWTDRAGGEKLRGMASISGNKSYRSDEKGVKDDWLNDYAGKSYGGERPSATEAYEIFTLGLQGLFYRDQRIDDKHKHVVLGILAASANP